MSEETLIVSGYSPTPRLRWLRPPGATTKPDRLQQAWRHQDTGEIAWEDIPVVTEQTEASTAGGETGG